VVTKWAARIALAVIFVGAHVLVGLICGWFVPVLTLSTTIAIAFLAAKAA
jgi:uncharacterized protein YneF (UPF0154 family)